MAIAEDLTLYLADHGVSVTAGAVSGMGILEQPGELALGGEMMLIDYAIRCEASKFGSLGYGDAVTVDGTAYTVENNPTPIDDGAFVIIPLVKV